MRSRRKRRGRRQRSSRKRGWRRRVRSRRKRRGAAVEEGGGRRKAGEKIEACCTVLTYLHILGSPCGRVYFTVYMLHILYAHIESICIPIIFFSHRNYLTFIFNSEFIMEYQIHNSLFLDGSQCIPIPYTILYSYSYINRQQEGGGESDISIQG